MFSSDIVDINHVLDLAKLKSTRITCRNPISMIVLILKTPVLLIQVIVQHSLKKSKDTPKGVSHSEILLPCLA